MKFPLRYLAVAGGLIVAAALVVGCEEEAAEVPLFPNSKVASLEGLQDTLDAMTGSALGGAEFEYQGYKAEASPEEITEFFKTGMGGWSEFGWFQVPAPPPGGPVAWGLYFDNDTAACIVVFGDVGEISYAIGRTGRLKLLGVTPLPGP